MACAWACARVWPRHMGSSLLVGRLVKAVSYVCSLCESVPGRRGAVAADRHAEPRGRQRGSEVGRGEVEGVALLQKPGDGCGLLRVEGAVHRQRLRGWPTCAVGLTVPTAVWRWAP